MIKKLIIGSDHAGFLAKEDFKLKLKDKYEIIDVGTNSQESVNYPQYGKEVALKTVEANNDQTLGIVFCGSGIGISIAANKVKGARCALIYSNKIAELAHQHNNANILAFAGQQFSSEQILEMFDHYINAKFEGGRHQIRVDMLNEL